MSGVIACDKLTRYCLNTFISSIGSGCNKAEFHIKLYTGFLQTHPCMDIALNLLNLLEYDHIGIASALWGPVEHLLIGYLLYEIEYTQLMQQGVSGV